MGLLDYEDMVCGWCESTNIEMIPLATVSVSGPALMFPLAYCRDCGAPFVPPKEVLEEKRKEWGDAIRESGRVNRRRLDDVTILKDAPPPPSPPKPKKAEAILCEKCGRKMSIKNRSEGRYTEFVLWECNCGFEKLEKNHDVDDLDPFLTDDFPEEEEDLS